MRHEFVIHEHSGYGELHYDLMLLIGESLATWRLPVSPLALETGDETPARKLPDHSKAYLIYEGPVSRNRGEVKILDKGTYDPLEKLPDRWEIRFLGRQIRGRWELVEIRPGSDSWVLRPLPES